MIAVHVVTPVLQINPGAAQRGREYLEDRHVQPGSRPLAAATPPEIQPVPSQDGRALTASFPASPGALLVVCECKYDLLGRLPMIYAMADMTSPRSIYSP